MPHLDNLFLVILNYFTNPVQLLWRKAMVSAQCDRLEPELAGHSAPLDVDMHRLITIETIEKETIRAGNILDRWHRINRYFIVLFTINPISKAPRSLVL
jgi:hypothetical protein